MSSDATSLFQFHTLMQVGWPKSKSYQVSFCQKKKLLFFLKTCGSSWQVAACETRAIGIRNLFLVGTAHGLRYVLAGCWQTVWGPGIVYPWQPKPGQPAVVEYSNGAFLVIAVVECSIGAFLVTVRFSHTLVLSTHFPVLAILLFLLLLILSLQRLVQFCFVDDPDMLLLKCTLTYREDEWKKINQIYFYSKWFLWSCCVEWMSSGAKAV